MTAKSQRATQLPFTVWWLSVPDPVRSIIQIVCARHCVSLWEIQSDKKTARIVVAREDLWRIMRARDYSFPQCARAIQKHHTTVMAAMRRDPKRYDKEKDDSDACT